MRVVAIDPRRTATAEAADLHLPVKPGTDVWLFNGLLAYLAHSGAADDAFVAAHTQGLDAALAAAGECASIEAVARRCGIDPRLVVEFFETGQPVALSGCRAVAAALIRDIRQGPEGFYVNVHNPPFPAGAVRGQLAK